MSILENETIRADDFINESEKDATPANDEGRVPKLEDDAKLSNEFLRMDFGDGSDGDVTISSPTTLTSDKYYNNLTVNDILSTGGYRVFVKGTLSGTGTIQNNGNNGTSASGITKGVGGIITSGYFSNTIGGDGAQGVTAGNSTGNAGSAGATVANSLLTTAGKTAGAGGNAPAQTGGAGGAGSTITGILIKFGILRFLSFAGLDISSTGALVKCKSTASAGGGGSGAVANGGSGNSGGGGGGGASGGILAVFSRIVSGTLTLKSVGGNGGNGGNASGTTYGGGGGGGSGGNGGYIYLIYSKKISTPTYNVVGGTKGLKGLKVNSGSDGIDGTDGNSGAYNEILIDNII